MESGGTRIATRSWSGRVDRDLAIALAAIVISAASLYVAVRQSQTERQLLAANAWPFLRAMLHSSHQLGQDSSFGVSNGGVGPAKIKSVEVFYDGVPVSSAPEFLSRCCGVRSGSSALEPSASGVIYSVVDEQVIRPGEEWVMLGLTRTDKSSDMADHFNRALAHVTFRACYCSVLDQCWTSDLRSTMTKPVATCPTPAHRYNPNPA